MIKRMSSKRSSECACKCIATSEINKGGDDSRSRADLVETTRSTIGKNHEEVASAVIRVVERILTVKGSGARQGSGQKLALAHGLGNLDRGEGQEWKGGGQGVVT